MISAFLVRWGLEVPFLAYGGVLAAVALGSFVHLRRWSRAAGLQAGRSLTIELGRALRLPYFRAALVGNFVEGWTDGGVRLLLVPVAVTGMFGRTAEWSGAALAAFAAGTAAGLPVGGWLADQRGRRPPALLGSATLAVAAVTLGASSTVPGLVVASVVSGLGTGLTSPSVNAALGDLATGRDGKGAAPSAMVWFQSAGDAGAVLGPITVGAVADLAGIVTAFSTAAVVAGVSFVMWLWVPERPR